MRQILSLSALLLICLYSFSQTPGAKWSRPLGGTGEDYGADIQKTSDGGFLFVGTTRSTDIDVTGNHGDFDVWLIKLNSLGQIQWQKCLGGTLAENSSKLLCYPDGSAIVMGMASSIDGDVSGIHASMYYDMWVIKIDGSGNIVWEKTLGGSNGEVLRDAQLTSDNGLIITSYTQSNDGDITGNHGYYDIWIVKLTGAGIVEWKKTLGGSGFDESSTIVQSNDGSYILIGDSESSDGDITGSHGDADLWIAKLDASGNILWKKAYGGSGTERARQGIISSDGSITVLGQTNSIDGDVIGRNSKLNQDCWVLNLDYNNGNIIWQKSIGGSAIENPVGLFQDADNMFIIASNTNSNDGDAVGNHGSYDILLTRLTSTGSIIWSKCFGGPKNELAWLFYHDAASKTYMPVATTNGNGGDVVGHHLNPSFDADDAWIVNVKYDGTLNWQRCLGGKGGSDLLQSISKVSDNNYVLTGQTNSNDGDVLLNRGGGLDAWAVLVGPINTVTGSLFLDNNLNGVKDVNESFFSNAMVKSNKVGDSVISIPYNGLFINEVDTGTYMTAPIPYLPYYTIVPSSASSSFSTYFNKDSISFALQPIANKQDLVVNLIPVTAARPGFASRYRIFYRNVGTTTISSGEILFKKDSRTTLVSSSTAVSSTNGDTLKWTYNNFAPGDTASILINLQVATPTTVNVGDTLAYMAIITPVAGDETPANDTAMLKQRTVGAIDPNDKTENNGGLITSSFITDGSYLQYTVRFQNTGTADAINVIVRDTLGNRVDLSTLEVVTASHPYSLSIENGNELTWTFNNIMLPASSVNEPASHGYIVYRIKPKSDVVVGETIHNTASIYFDYNLPVLTNDAITLVQDNFSALPVQLVNFTGQLTNNTVQINWQTANETNFERFEIERSFDGAAFVKISSVAFVNAKHNYTATDNVSALTSKHIFYRLKLVDADGKFSYSKVIAFNINADQNRFTVYPNPANTEIFVSITAGQKSNLQIKIIDASGRTVSEEQKTIEKGNNVFPVNTSKLKKGNYLLQIVSGEETKTSKFIIMN